MSPGLYMTQLFYKNYFRKKHKLYSNIVPVNQMPWKYVTSYSMKSYNFAISCIKVSFILEVLLLFLQAELLQIFKWQMTTISRPGDGNFMLPATYSCEQFHRNEKVHMQKEVHNDKGLKMPLLEYNKPFCNLGQFTLEFSYWNTKTRNWAQFWRRLKLSQSCVMLTFCWQIFCYCIPPSPFTFCFPFIFLFQFARCQAAKKFLIYAMTS